ncbi:MAG: hypothetical protein U0800_02895, partial [Isosphaeraceae bacterium]
MEQLDLVRHAIEILERLSIPYVLVGSWGSGIYGEPRFTRDVIPSSICRWPPCRRSAPRFPAANT